MKTKLIIMIIIGIIAIVTGIFSFISISHTSSFSIVADDDSECWVEIDGGVLTRCQMIGEFPPGYDPIPHPTLQNVFCEKNCMENNTILLGGQWGLDICNVVGGPCASYYPGMMNQNGSISIGQVISDREKIEHYYLLIQNEELSYVKTVKEHEK